MKPIPRSFWVTLSAFLFVVALCSSYVAIYNNSRQTCTQDWVSGKNIECHHPNTNENAGTTFVYNPQK